jgi:hypothetical protein
VTGGCTGVCPASGVSVPVGAGGDGVAEGLDGVGEAAPLVAVLVPGDGTAGGWGLPAGRCSRTARTTATSTRAAASAMAAVRRRLFPGSGSVGPLPFASGLLTAFPFRTC